MTAENRYEFLQAQRSRLERPQSGRTRGCAAYLIGNVKTPFLGKTPDNAIDLAHSIVDCSRAEDREQDTATKAATKTRSGQRRELTRAGPVARVGRRNPAHSMRQIGSGDPLHSR